MAAESGCVDSKIFLDRNFFLIDETGIEEFEILAFNIIIKLNILFQTKAPQ